MKKLLSLIVFLVYLIPLEAQNNSSVLPGLDLLGNNEKIEIPFRYISGYILLDVQLQGILPQTFIFDTGAEHTILFEKYISDLLGIQYDKEIQLKGADLSQTITAYISRGINLQIEKTKEVSRDIVILEENFLNLKELIGINIDGIIGGRYFNNLIIEIDYNKTNLILWHPDKFNKNLSKFTSSPMEVIANKPYIKCKTSDATGTEHQVNLLVDTGASLTFLLNSYSEMEFQIPENAVPGNLGKGIGGFIEGYKGKIHRLEIDEYEFTNVLTHFQNLQGIDVDFEKIYRNGLIGNQLLERFTIIIDYLNRKIYFKPIRKLNKPFRYNLSGMILLAFGPNLEQYIVFEVTENSPAYRAGIMRGDVIKRIGLFSSNRYTLFQIERMMSSRAGRTFKLKILRDNQILSKEITLEDFLKQ